MPSRTTNKIHFSDLKPERFEDLCTGIVSRLKEWKELIHFGRMGSDGGVDIQAIESLPEGDKTWAIQCKCYQRVGKSDIKEVVDKISGQTFDKLLLIVGCDVSRASYNYLKTYSQENNIDEVEVWTASNIEAKLYGQYRDLLFVYFGIRLNPSSKSSSSRLNHALRMRKRMLKDFISKGWMEKYGPNAEHQCRLNYFEVNIRDVDDRTYPYDDGRSDGQISAHFKTYIYDFYHRGMEVWLSAVGGCYALIDQHGFWEPVYSMDPRLTNSKYTNIRVDEIGQIPFDSIVNYDLDGDEYTSEPHIFCKFEWDGGMPYERIYYRYMEGLNLELEENKRTQFPK